MLTFVKMFTVSDWATKESWSLAVSWLKDMTDTLLPDQSLFAVHDVQDVISKEALATNWLTTTTDKLSWEVNKKSDMLVFLPWGREASKMYYYTPHKMKW